MNSDLRAHNWSFAALYGLRRRVAGPECRKLGESLAAGESTKLCNKINSKLANDGPVACARTAVRAKLARHGAIARESALGERPAVQSLARRMACKNLSLRGAEQRICNSDSSAVSGIFLNARLIRRATGVSPGVDEDLRNPCRVKRIKRIRDPGLAGKIGQPWAALRNPLRGTCRVAGSECRSDPATRRRNLSSLIGVAEYRVR